jgi:hypothetical protein
MHALKLVEPPASAGILPEQVARVVALSFKRTVIDRKLVGQLIHRKHDSATYTELRVIL